MNLYFKPNPFIDKNGVKIELEDIEIEDIQPERCDCGCDAAFLNITIVRHKHEPATFKDVGIEELQQLIESAWNSSSIPDLVFKRKNSLGRLDKDSGVKLQLDEQGLKDMNKGLEVALEIINEEDLDSKLTKEELVKKYDWYEMECPACGRDAFEFGYNSGNCVCGLMNK